MCARVRGRERVRVRVLARVYKVILLQGVAKPQPAKPSQEGPQHNGRQPRNSALATGGKKGGNTSYTKSMEDLSDFLENNGLVDLELEGSKYTWANRRVGTELIQIILDRFLVIHLYMINQIYSLKSLPRIGSNDNPILLNLGLNLVKKERPFKLENIWLDHPDLFNKIQE